MIILALSLAHAAPAPKVAVCHYDGSSYQTISVSANAAAAHVANHGDVYPGAYHPDIDGDGYGDPYGGTVACPAPGYTLDASDCDDFDATINPAGEEVCDDEVDNDCDLQADEECDPGTICPCAALDEWNVVMEEGVPVPGSCQVYDHPGYMSGIDVPVSLDGADTYKLLASLGYITGCQVDNSPGNPWNFIYPITEEESLACQADIEAWAESHGEVCW